MLEEEIKIKVLNRLRKYNLLIIVVILCSIGYQYLTHNRDFKTNLVFEGLVLLFLLIDYIVSFTKLYYHEKVLHGIKYILLISIMFAIVFITKVMTLTVFLIGIYIFHMVIAVLLSNINDKVNISTLTSEIVSPFVFAVSFYYVVNATSNYEIIIIIAFTAISILIAIAALGTYGEVLQIYYDDLSKQERLFFYSEKDNDSMKRYQNELIKANEQLNIQKIQLEAANSRIVKNNAEMEIQYKIMKDISASLELDQLLDYITTSLIEYMDIDVCTMGITMNKGAVIKISARDSSNGDIAKDIIDSFNHYKIERLTFANGEVYINNNVDLTDKRLHYLRKSEVKSLLVHDYQFKEDVIGFLLIGKNKQNYFTDNVNFYNNIIEQYCIAVSNAILYSNAEENSIRDGLTGIYNRRYLTKVYPDLCNKSVDENKPLSIALFDIDYFKKINDTYGHLFGDIIIQKCAAIANEVVKMYNGLTFRYGGEEFVLLFQGMDVDECDRIMKELHKAIKKAVFVDNGKEVKIDISIGITSYPTTCGNPDDLLNRADWSMYAAKKQGRGRIVIDNEDIGMTF